MILFILNYLKSLKKLINKLKLINLIYMISYKYQKKKLNKYLIIMKKKKKQMNIEHYYLH